MTAVHVHGDTSKGDHPVGSERDVGTYYDQPAGSNIEEANLSKRTNKIQLRFKQERNALELLDSKLVKDLRLYVGF